MRETKRKLGPFEVVVGRPYPRKRAGVKTLADLSRAMKPGECYAARSVTEQSTMLTYFIRLGHQCRTQREGKTFWVWKGPEKSKNGDNRDRIA